ncbi:hypothetical protein [Metabacillus halosaccharovorans]|uniref:hypothetical protein n=1 Tax=Metabacillus halosaccharovorans TaxID=930124 RepID=UPI001C1F9491|nr:hypothetical protein [Metabacillus halosaccharovorans]MBU7594484.1 hypothetical protein [Metabacillus halosaccharovorans]
MDDKYKVTFSGESINTVEDIMNIKEFVEKMDTKVLTVDKKLLLSIIDYTEGLQQELEDADDAIFFSGGL